jgi:uncharacterized membrane protein YoaK (UPF0700 family)
MGHRLKKPRPMENILMLLSNLAQLDWGKAVQFWILVAMIIALCEAAVLVQRGIKEKKENKDA